MTGGLLPDDALLDDQGRLEDADPGSMLRACASAGAQVRSSARAAQEAGLERVAADGRPRAVVVAGSGVGAQAGAVLASVAGPACPVPITVVRDAVLPGWVGPLDIVIAVSSSGRTPETFALAEEAARRGARLVTVAAGGSALQRLAEQVRGVHIGVEPGGRPPRALLWALAVPVLAVADALGLVAVPASELAAVADLLDRSSEHFAPSHEVGANPAKDLALALAGTLPLVWAAAPVASVAAHRLVSQLAATAKLPAVPGDLPEVGHGALEVLGGPLAGGSGDDIFLDPYDRPAGLTLRAVVVRDDSEHPRSGAAAVAVAAVADGRGVPVTVLRGEGESALQRLATVISLIDFATTYLALATGVDPGRTPAVDEMQDRLEDRQ